MQTMARGGNALGRRRNDRAFLPPCIWLQLTESRPTLLARPTVLSSFHLRRDYHPYRSGERSGDARKARLARIQSERRDRELSPSKAPVVFRLSPGQAWTIQ